MLGKHCKKVALKSSRMAPHLRTGPIVAAPSPANPFAKPIRPPRQRKSGASRLHIPQYMGGDKRPKSHSGKSGTSGVRKASPPSTLVARLSPGVLLAPFGVPVKAKATGTRWSRKSRAEKDAYNTKRCGTRTRETSARRCRSCHAACVAIGATGPGHPGAHVRTTETRRAESQAKHAKHSSIYRS